MSATTPSARWEALLGASLSLAVHVFVAFFLWQLPPATQPTAEHPELEWLSSTEATSEGTSGSVRGAASPLVLGIPSSAQNVDADRRGEGGDLDGAVEFTLLVSTAHAVQLQDSVNNSGRVSQAQRIRTASDRASWENRRATPNPDSQPFLASGEGVHRQRRPVRATDATTGARQASRAAVAGDTASAVTQGASGPGVQTAVEGSAGEDVSDRREGAEAASPGQGIEHGRGAREQVAANVAHGRPDIDRGPAATLASDADRVRDDRDAERLAAQLVESNVDASRRAGRHAGEGRGGVGGGGAPGSGGSAGAGGRASAHGPGEGAGGLDTSSRRYRTWYLALRRRVEDALVFPRERMLAMDQGQAVFRIQVARDGSLVGDAAQLRSSGFSDMDRAAASAIASATPFARIPSDLAPHSESIQVDLTVAFANPMVR